MSVLQPLNHPPNHQWIGVAKCEVKADTCNHGENNESVELQVSNVATYNACKSVVIPGGEGFSWLELIGRISESRVPQLFKSC